MTPTDMRELVAVMRREKRSNLLVGMEGARQTPEPWEQTAEPMGCHRENSVET